MKITSKLFAISFGLLIGSSSYAEPAARVGDATSGGGHIISGSSTVLINSLGAARVGDNIVTPLVVGLVPCVGGPILPPGSATVLINGLPAARSGDLAATVCGPETIVIGSPNVLIGN